MPLKALLDGEAVVAPLLGDQEWLELYFQRHRLALPCCPGVAVQMRGGAGTARIQHFSHTPLPTCQFRGETTAHLRAKAAIAQGAATAGWAVDIEHAADGWRADVLAERAGQRVAFEVQRSRQTLGELAARQARYRVAGVRGCWFVRHPPRSKTATGSLELVARPDLPLFSLVGGSEGARVQFGGGTYPLEEVVAVLLSRRIAFRTHRTVVGEQVLEIAFYEKSCPEWRASSSGPSAGSWTLAPARACCPWRIAAGPSSAPIKMASRNSAWATTWAHLARAAPPSGPGLLSVVSRPPEGRGAAARPRAGAFSPHSSLPRARRQILAHLLITISCPVCQARVPVPTRAAARCRPHSRSP
jgi:hypothetical protein